MRYLLPLSLPCDPCINTQQSSPDFIDTAIILAIAFTNLPN